MLLSLQPNTNNTIVLIRYHVYILLFCLLNCCGLHQLSAQKTFDFTPACKQAYKEIFALKLDAGKAILETEKTAHPDNTVPYLLENYIDFFRLFFNEDPAVYSGAKPNWDKRLKLLDQVPATSPFRQFAKSLINIQWAAVEIKFGNKWSAGWAFRDAFKLAKENKQRFPDFTPNNMVTGPMQMIAGTIPPGYKWLSNVLGIKGSIAEGSKQLNSFINAKDDWALLYRDEAIFYNCYMKFYLQNQPGEALQFINTRKLDVVNNHLFAFMAANLSLNNQQSSATIDYVVHRNPDTAYMPASIWDFELGHAKLNHLEPDAGEYLQRFLDHFKGNFYVKDTWLKLGWHYLVQGDSAKYKACLQKVLIKGNAETDADKRALKEAKAGKVLNIVLLRSRLLTDGGYHAEALAALANLTTGSFTLPEEKVELTYRLGRIYEDLKRTDEAIRFYAATIKAGQLRTEYFAARAALQTGLLYEARNNKTLAMNFYQQCIDMKDHDFENSLEQKAKAGIARCSGQ